jgi:nicotinate-nucleotide pyrophosphorylase (carboxylating)
MHEEEFETLLGIALREDLGDLGDVTSEAIFPIGHKSSAVLFSKDSGLLCGGAYFKRVFSRIDPELSCELLLEDGRKLEPGQAVARLDGSTISILKGERTAINFIGFLSGIASQARAYQDECAKKGGAVILDTRKTLPGYRALSKYAVRTGGGKNHRMGLHDMVLIKDNHIDAAGGIQQSVEKARAAWKDRFPIEVECRSVEDVRVALANGVTWIMLDNMGEADCAAALALPRPAAAGPIVFEASGNMSLERVGGYSALGLTYVSVGALTHSVKTFDFSLRMEGGRA